MFCAMFLTSLFVHMFVYEARIFGTAIGKPRQAPHFVSPRDKAVWQPVWSGGPGFGAARRRYNTGVR